MKMIFNTTSRMIDELLNFFTLGEWLITSQRPVNKLPLKAMIKTK